ncbi:MAG: hypothetical protein MUP47_00695, partial [Phycisphaerae bacterium]|nr:hypothetical protein [Phycisphaerae bacterium]
MLWWTWGTWPDVMVDFGRELNIAWKVWRGQTLYSQVAHYRGPLSPYLNALWFGLFGPSIRTLEVCNLAILAGLIGLLYHMFKRLSGRAVSTVACVVFLLLFAFARFVRCGNYNYVCPYTHEMSHGLLLGMVSLAAMWGFRRRKMLALVASGLALGGVFLTTLEVFVGALGGTGMALLLSLIAYGGNVRKSLGSLGVFCASAALVPLAALLALSRIMPVGQAAEGLLASYRAAANPELRRLKFYLDGAGLSDVSGNLRALFLSCGAYLMVLVPLVLLALAVRKRFRDRWPGLRAGFIVATGGILLGFWGRIDWFSAARPLPVVLLVGAIVSLVGFCRHRRNGDR